MRSERRLGFHLFVSYASGGAQACEESCVLASFMQMAKTECIALTSRFYQKG